MELSYTRGYIVYLLVKVVHILECTRNEKVIKEEND